VKFGGGRGGEQAVNKMTGAERIARQEKFIERFSSFQQFSTGRAKILSDLCLTFETQMLLSMG
jgi:hypothetical protein